MRGCSEKGWEMTKSRRMVVLVTCGTLPEARRIARSAVESRVAACVNIQLNPVESIYRWKNKVQVAREYLLVFKTAAARFPELEKLVHRLHSYDVPECIVLPMVSGSAGYLRWIDESTKPSSRS